MSRFVYVIPFALLALASCNRDRTDRSNPLVNEPGTTTVTGALLANTTAVSRIADGRCTRELACNNVGVEKRYATHDACVQQMRQDMVEDLGVAQCPAGIDAKELDECLSEIRAESCNNPLDKLERLAACRSSDLCVKSAPNR
ncbi:MAG: hypothetical protein KIT84_04225 [Labilithrix sp.]|nr:hypothetical protein [Labilithrix sp.]MCW5810193.1 hypothetical protein [Labilithrix sp.]